MNLTTYWETTPKRLEKYIKVYIEKEKQRVFEMDWNNYNLGKYVAFAFNSPKKYPSKPFLQEEKKSGVMTAKEMEEVMRRNTLTLGGKIK